VHVEEARLAGVDAVTQRLVALVRRAPGDRIGARELAVEGTLNSRPASCSARARAASARGITLAAPAGVKPLKPIVAPCWISAAASAAVRVGNALVMRFSVWG
jgi:hypothetical protein